MNESKLPGMLEVFLKLSSQAVILFDKGLTVLPQFSHESKRIFGQDLSGRRIAQLLFTQAQDIEDFEIGMSLVLDGKVNPDVVFDLIEKEIEIGGRSLRLDFRLVEGPVIALFASDITRERRFQEISKRDLTRRFLVLKAVSHQRYFALYHKEALELFAHLMSFEEKLPSIQEALDLERILHTFKGSSSFFDFVETVEKAHLFESFVQEYRVLGEELNINELSIELKKTFFVELSSITNILGSKWLLGADSIAIPRESYYKIEAWVAKFYPKDLKLRHALQQYKQVQMRELFARFPEMVQGLAERLGKRVNSVIVEGGEFYVNPDYVSNFVTELIHVIRNSLDHGIEIPSERIRMKKSDSGTLRIQIEEQVNSITVRISDDGKGIDLDKLKDRAISIGLTTKELAEQLSEAEILQFITAHGFSTAQEISDISGRGIGMGAVKEVLQKMGGEMQIHSRKGQGTTVECNIPFRKTTGREIQ